MVRIGEESHQFFFQDYRPINKSLPAVFVFWPFKGVKRAKKYDFLKLAWYSPKNGNVWPKCLPDHFGGYFTRFLDSVLRLGRSKCHFLARENATSARFIKSNDIFSRQIFTKNNFISFRLNLVKSFQRKYFYLIWAGAVFSATSSKRFCNK